jgi:ankyrin repeat protein
MFAKLSEAAETGALNAMFLIQCLEDSACESMPELLNLRGRAGETVLRVAAKSGQYEVVSALLDAGADPVATTNNKNNALTAAGT